MNYEVEDLVFEAIEAVLSWDLSDEACPEAIAVEAALLAGVEPDELQPRWVN